MSSRSYEHIGVILDFREVLGEVFYEALSVGPVACCGFDIVAVLKEICVHSVYQYLPDVFACHGCQGDREEA